ncbi:MAG: hypothetical protein H7234_00150 [Herminiimonas sp.]|nr:hypothetical protein [Herminiimonas sp.]
MKNILARPFLPCALFAASIFVAVNAHAVGLGNLFGSILGQSGGQHMGVDETLVKMSDKMNRSMPQTVDTDTRLDKISAEPGNQIAYHYTMLKVQSKDINTASFYKTFRPTLQKRVCAAEELKLFFRNRVTVAYAYQGADGADIGKLAFSPKDCGYPS